MGQFVLINNESQLTAECRGKLNIPHQSLLYKILEIHKDGFSCRLLDILDGSKKEVLCSRLTNLSLEVLEEYNFSTPQFYKNLQKLTDQARNCYEAPTARNTGRKLLQTGSVPETGPGGPDPIVQPGVAPHNHWVDPHNHWTDDRATNFTQDPAAQDPPGGVRTGITGDDHSRASFFSQLLVNHGRVCQISCEIFRI